MDMDFLGKQIQKYRKEAGLSQEELAENVGLSQIHLAYLEQGRRRPSLNALINISNILGISMDLLVGFESNENVPARIKQLNHAIKKFPLQNQQRILATIESIVEIEAEFLNGKG